MQRLSAVFQNFSKDHAKYKTTILEDEKLSKNHQIGGKHKMFCAHVRLGERKIVINCQKWLSEKLESQNFEIHKNFFKKRTNLIHHHLLCYIIFSTGMVMNGLRMVNRDLQSRGGSAVTREFGKPKLIFINSG